MSANHQDPLTDQEADSPTLREPTESGPTGVSNSTTAGSPNKSHYSSPYPAEEHDRHARTASNYSSHAAPPGENQLHEVSHEPPGDASGAVVAPKGESNGNMLEENPERQPKPARVRAYQDDRRTYNTHDQSFQNSGGKMSMASVPDVYRQSFQFRPQKPVISSRRQKFRYIFLVLACVAFLLLIIGTPLEMFRSRYSSTCVTLWGSRPTCGSSRYDPTDWGCSSRNSKVNAARAFCIVSLILSALSILTGVLLALQVGFLANRHLIPALLSLSTVLTLLIAWACVAGIYNESQCEVIDEATGTVVVEGTALKEVYKYGAGFGLLVASWCLQVIATAFESFA